MHNNSNSLLRVEGLVAGYGKKQVLNNVSFNIKRGEILAVIGHNGAGKTSLLKAIFGALRVWRGKIYFENEPLDHVTTRQKIDEGISYIPQGNMIFSNLSVYENLILAGKILCDKKLLSKRIKEALEVYSDLKNRLKQCAGSLSGGEKQMLALTRVIILQPRLLLIDEPSLGLSFDLVKESLNRISKISKELGTTVLIVEQKVREVIRIADNVMVLRNGRITYLGPASSLMDDKYLKRVYF